jgi:hypothetical protein
MTRRPTVLSGKISKCLLRGHSIYSICSMLKIRNGIKTVGRTSISLNAAHSSKWAGSLYRTRTSFAPKLHTGIY